MKPKFYLFKLLLITAFFVLWSRLFYLQIIQGEENRAKAEENRIKIERVPAPRGVIYDTKNKLLVRNKPQGREYIYDEVLAHLIGYIGEASEDELSTFDYLQLKDKVGKMGIEKQYDEMLRGRDGGVLIEKDSQGKTIREIKRQEPESGQSISLTIDLDLQQKAFSAIKDKIGSVVITNPQNGAVLSLVSSSSFNPNIFSQEKDTVDEILTDPNQPMFNRAIAGLYPPGSTYKIITAIAGLEERVIDKNTEYEDTGILKIGDYSYANWYFTQYGRTEGMVDILKAIQRSNDIYFYKVGEGLGIEALNKWSFYFGLGSVTGIDIPGEASGLVPTPQWKKENKLERWYLGDTIITSIGQGDLQLTPIQVNQMAGVIASGGKLCQPYLVDHTSDGGARQEAETTPPRWRECQSLNINPENLSLVKEGMKLACQEGGTGWPFFGFQPAVGCKTGTAEFGDPNDKTHAWFTVFAPWENPEILVTVLLEKGGEGSTDAGPVALEILKRWFEEKR